MKTLNKKDKDLLYALALGDGCIYYDNKRNRYQLSIGHGPKQKDYCIWKLGILNKSGIFEKQILLHCSKIFDKRNSKTYIQYHFKKTSPILKELWEDYHSEDRIERILSNIHSDMALAIWFMDDGCVEKHKNKHVDGTIHYARPSFHLCTHCFTEEENIKILKWFMKRYQIEPRLAHDNRKSSQYTYLRIGAIDSEKIYRIIRPYVLQIESMRQKFKYIEEYYFSNDNDLVSGEIPQQKQD